MEGELRGLLLLHDDIREATIRGCRVRLVTGDYLAITQESALQRLLAWTALGTSPDEPDVGATTETDAPGFAARIVETARLDPPGSAFHPKAWLFEGPDLATAFVGSSNVSRSALAVGVEWNLRTDRASNPAAWERLRRAFEDLWASASLLTPEWVSAYALRAREAARTRARGAAPAPVPGEIVPDEAPDLFPPHRLQEAGLAALAKARGEQRGRCLVVMATGLGKTWLAAFDLATVAEELGRFPRVLFVAHRAEILEQAAATFGRLAESKGVAPRVSWYAGSANDLDGEMAFASVQKLSRPEGLRQLAAQRFDYVVVDEVHHAAAASYRRVLDRIDAGFVVGLTATPDRADEADILGLFDDHVAYRADMGEGIAEGLLAPFAYLGLKDTVDYANIPWRNARFDPEVLTTAAATEARMARLWEAWQKHPAARTLVFCCSVRHAAFVEEWLTGKGVRTRAVTADTGPTDRSDALSALREGSLDALCAVDLFNEGIDLPSLDRVVMLRPTESPVVFVQQLGRGLRRSEGKETLTVIDFVGNHRVFLDRLRLLLSFGRTGVSLRQFLVDDASPELPAGCSMEVELEAIEMLRFLVPRGESETARAYRELKAARGERPTAGELFRMGYTLPAGRWFPFVREEGDLDDSQANVLAAAEEWFADLQTTQMAKSYKMVLLEALLEAGTLSTGLRLDDLAARSYRILRRSPELAGDLEVASLDGLAGASDPRWLPYWKENPVRAWTEGPHRRWFKLEGDTFVPRLPVPEGLGDVFEAMTRELVDYRLAQYRRRSERMPSGGSFACKVLWNKRDPILKLPPRSQTAAVPAGERDVRLPDGSVWRFRFRNKSCYVAGPAGKDRNELPDLLRGWFGPNAGKPGTAFHVRFSAAPDGLWVEPERTATAEVLSFPSRTLVTSYPSLRAAAGAARRDSFGAFDEGPDSPGETVALPISRPTHRLFAARAIGSSMDGGPSPIRDGDWVVMRWARGEVPKNLFTTRKVVLVETAGSGGDGAYQLKRIVREDGKWLLRSDNPETPDFDATEETVPIAVLVETVRPEQLAPETGSLVSDDRLAEAFGLPERPSTGRVMGHLFLLAEERGPFVAPDRVSFPVVRRPGETVFVLARVSKDAPWRYCGTGRWHEQESAWDVPELDWGTWHALGAGRSASRRIPAGCEREAAALIARILEKAERGAGHFVREGRTIRVLGPTDRGGLRIDGGPGGFGERTVSKTDFAWVLAARRDVAANGGLLDEHRVNRLRYLEGTPYDSTRWIDTRTALQLLEP